MLPSRTGKYFYDTKKTPVLIDLSNAEELPKAITKAIGSTYLVMGTGPAYNVKTARVSMSPAKCVKNIESVVAELVTMFGSDKIRRIELKGDSTASFPIYWHLTSDEINSFK